MFFLIRLNMEICAIYMTYTTAKLKIVCGDKVIEVRSFFFWKWLCNRGTLPNVVISLMVNRLLIYGLTSDMHTSESHRRILFVGCICSSELTFGFSSLFPMHASSYGLTGCTHRLWVRLRKSVDIGGSGF